MTLALEEAKKATPSPTAFCVGCVLVVSPQSDNPVVLSTGYSRELPGNTHAEANALDKAKLLTSKDLKNLYPVLGDFDVHSLLARTDVYTTLEPCSIRTSGLSPCADALIEAKVRRCIIGVSEPPDFVECEGAERLKEAGIDVIWLAGLEDECLKVARREH
ncbi:cytidine deaminase-like protein [Ephemerocybe angulata]|uniref:Cytidine deaminase-like protein n=1 Tax=Ephemerocybe angulata TaxID=980116 RepID=A0A8H6IJ50_9AGAR|nr:cytidine deaminase-like protein [Tulosesus angulatus]